MYPRPSRPPPALTLSLPGMRSLHSMPCLPSSASPPPVSFCPSLSPSSPSLFPSPDADELEPYPLSLSSSIDGPTLTDTSYFSSLLSRPHSPALTSRTSLSPPSPQPDLSLDLPPCTPITPSTPFTLGPTSPRSRRLTKPRPPPPRRPLPAPPFEPEAPLTPVALELAAQLDVYDEAGAAVPFRSLFWDQRTVVCFIRHFWCPLCQDYMRSITREVDPEALERAGLKLVIVSNGSPKMIRAYRDVFRCPYPLYTDPNRALYQALGMTLRTLDGGPEEEKGAYVEHGQIGGLVMVLKHAMKMPLANAGDIKQLGGEFVLGPGLSSTYAHRMTTTRSHAPVLGVLAAAGADLSRAQWEQMDLMTEEEEEAWMAGRERALQQREERRRRRPGTAARRERERREREAEMEREKENLEVGACVDVVVDGDVCDDLGVGGRYSLCDWMGGAVERSEGISLVRDCVPGRPSVDTVESSLRVKGLAF